MKRNLFSAAIAMILCLFLFSCKKDDIGSKKENVLYENDFSGDDERWFVGTREEGISLIDNGYLIMKNGSEPWDFWQGSLFGTSSKDGAIEASVKLATSNGADYGTGGLIWGYENANNGKIFYFAISHDGYYAIAGFPNGTIKDIVLYKDWLSDNIVKQNQFNKLRIELRNGELRFLINNKEVHRMKDPGANTLDRSGLFEQEYTIMQTDYFKAVAFE